MSKKDKEEKVGTKDEIVEIETIIAERDLLLKENAELEAQLKKAKSHSKGLQTKLTKALQGSSGSKHTLHK